MKLFETKGCSCTPSGETGAGDAMRLQEAARGGRCPRRVAG
jgi:hypothetical protein